MAVCAVFYRPRCPAVLTPISPNYSALRHPTRRRLSLYEAHNVVATNLAGPDLNWAVLVAYAIKTSSISQSVLILYAGLIFWTVGYDTVYACQDKEDDALIGIKSTARRFGAYVRPAVAICFIVMTALLFRAIGLEIIQMANPGIEGGFWSKFARTQLLKPAFGLIALLCALLLSIAYSLDKEGKNALGLFKLNRWIGFYIVSLLICLNFLWGFN